MTYRRETTRIYETKRYRSSSRAGNETTNLKATCYCGRRRSWRTRGRQENYEKSSRRRSLYLWIRARVRCRTRFSIGRTLHFTVTMEGFGQLTRMIGLARKYIILGLLTA